MGKWNILGFGIMCLWVLSVKARTLPPCEFPAIYNFGDSNSDAGGISAAFEPIPAPYGEAFFHKPSGRCSDGRLIIDFIAEKFKLPYLSAVAEPGFYVWGGSFYHDNWNYFFKSRPVRAGKIFLSYNKHGANFATGGSTITRQNETIFEYGISPFSLDMQIAQFKQFKSRTIDLYNQVKNTPEAGKLPRPDEFTKALYTFDIGQIDLSIGFRKMGSDRLRASLPDIVNQLATAIQHLYIEGGRAFWIHNTGPFGCLPMNQFYVSKQPHRTLDEYGCVKAQNEMAVEFNTNLKDRVIELRAELPEAAITYVDVYAAKFGLISKAKTLGLADPMKVCCGYHVNSDHIWCGCKGMVNKTEVHGIPCKDTSSFISWDGLHYTQAANRWVADRTHSGSLVDPPIPITRACHRE